MVYPVEEKVLLFMVTCTYMGYVTLVVDAYAIP